MESVGSYLHAQRKEKGLTLEAVHEKTKISVAFLEAIEADQFDGLGAETYVIGFLRSYARVLELDPQEILGKYRGSQRSTAEEAEVRQALRDLGEQSVRGGEGRVWEWRSWTKWGGVAAAAWLAAYLLVGFFSSHIPKEAPYFAKSLAEAKKAAGIKDDHIYLLGSAVEDVWVSVQPDDGTARTLTMKKGDTAVWKARKIFFLKIGNAGGLELQLNDRPLGVLGRSEEVIPALTIEANGRLRYGPGDGTATQPARPAGREGAASPLDAAHPAGPVSPAR